MENFRFENSTRIVFGRGTQRCVGKYVREYSNNVLILYGSDRIKEEGLLNEVESSLEDAQVDFLSLGGVVPNPVLSKVKEGADICKEHGINFILAIGGGSVIDSAKAIAMKASTECDIWEYFCHKARPLEIQIKIGVILTIAASGSESSGSVVITNDEIYPREKRDYTSKLLRPSFAILNPELTCTLPWDSTACGGVDILAHVFERYFTRVKNVELTDRLCEATMITVINALRRLKTNLFDYDARAELMWAGTIAHNNILSTGRRSDWASHMIEHEMSAMFNISHGDGLAMIITAWMRYVYESDIDRFCQFSTRVWNVENSNKKVCALAGIEATEKFFRELGRSIGIGNIVTCDEQLQYIAKSATKYGNIGDFKILSTSDVLEILNIAMKMK